ncbi:MAG TPA: phosphotransferase [Ktedonobacteraceae bacterium]|nr:phosphotransferase [Ktedonobacteraceae bacterium]
MHTQRFEDLTRGGQVRRMKRLAETALAAYDLGEVQLTPLMHFFNTTFRIDTCPHLSTTNQEHPEAGAGERFVIRIHRPGSQDKVTIQSELVWLLALRHEAGLVVPEPVPTRDGALVTTASTAGVPEPRDCVVFRWVYGRFLRASLGVKELERVGAFLAKLHRHSEHFVVPEGFFRKRWDYDGLRSGVLGTDLEQSWAHLSQEDRVLLDAIGERVKQTMHMLGEGRKVFGLIHADFYERNYLFSNGEVHAIDFDGGGWGYYLFDIGVAFSTLLARNDYPALRKAFLEGYRQVQPLTAEHESLIDTFIAARLMCHVLWLAAHLDEPSYGLRAARRIEYELGELKHFLDQEFLLSS